MLFETVFMTIPLTKYKKTLTSATFTFM